MNKNIIIGLLIAVVLIAGGWYFLTKTSDDTNSMATSTAGTTTGTATGTSNNGTATGTGIGTATGTVTPGATTPGKPSVQTDPNVAPSNSTAVVVGRVTPNGASTVYWYEYGTTEALGARTASQTIGSGYSSIASPGYITGLAANTKYFFRLSAQNLNGTVSGATYSFSTNTTPPPQGSAPTAKTGNTTGISSAGGNVSGQVNPNGVATTYWFEYGTGTDLGSVTSFVSVGSGKVLIPVSAALSGLNSATKYYYRVNAQNQFGTVSGAIQNFNTSGPTSPGVPTVSTSPATQITKSSATLDGRLNPNGSETTYWFEYSQDSLLGSIIGTMTPTQTLASGSATVSVSSAIANLSANTKYFYRLVARNQSGTVKGSVDSFKTRP